MTIHNRRPPARRPRCTSCHDKLDRRHRNGAHNHSQRIKTAFAVRRARGASIGRPKKLMPHQRKEALVRLESGESRADVARSYGASARLRLVAWCVPHAFQAASRQASPCS